MEIPNVLKQLAGTAAENQVTEMAGDMAKAGAKLVIDKFQGDGGEADGAEGNADGGFDLSNLMKKSSEKEGVGDALGQFASNFLK